MLRRRSYLMPVLAAAALALPVAAQSADEQAKLSDAAERGRLLYQIDRAAWVATDDLLAKVKDPERQGFKGYVVERTGDGFTVTFYTNENGRLAAGYVASVADGKVAESRTIPAGSRPSLTPMQLRLAAARDVAPKLGYRSCTSPFNAAPIPPASVDAPLDLYLLSPQVRPKEYPFGGHFKVTVAPDGKVLAKRKFTNSCLNMPEPPGRGSEPVAMVVSHLLDPVPTEIHVFTSLTAGKPVYVVTRTGLWHVNGPAIRRVQGAPR